MSKLKFEPYERDVLPRHMRSLPCPAFWVGKAVHESEQVLPILDNLGNKIAEKRVVVQVPAGESMSAYHVEDFKLGNLLSAGVPLEEVNFMLNSRNANEQLIQKAIELGVYDEEMSVFRPQVVAPVVNQNDVEPLNPVSDEQ